MARQLMLVLVALLVGCSENAPLPAETVTETETITLTPTPSPSDSDLGEVPGIVYCTIAEETGLVGCHNDPVIGEGVPGGEGAIVIRFGHDPCSYQDNLQPVGDEPDLFWNCTGEILWLGSERVGAPL